MASGSFVCKNCKKSYSKDGIIWSSDKFKCSKHGEICVRCVKGKLFGGYVCPKCGNKVIEYKYSESYGKWMKV